jgi:GNAT superfamily N-acetyltransferase
MVDVRVATQQDRAVLAAALASAFAEDPFFRWLAGPSAPLEARMRIMFDAVLKQNLRKPEHMIFVAENGTSGAVWQPVGRWKVPPADLVRSLPAMLRGFRSRTPALLGALSAIEKVHPTEPHYYLEVLGTQQGQQSRGAGSSMIKVVLDRCDQEGVPAYLESSNPRNVPFYARHGFEVTSEVACGKGAPVVTAMWREPRS